MIALPSSSSSVVSGANCMWQISNLSTMATESMVHFGISDQVEKFMFNILYHIFSFMHILLYIFMPSIILSILLYGKQQPYDQILGVRLPAHKPRPRTPLSTATCPAMRFRWSLKFQSPFYGQNPAAGMRTAGIRWKWGAQECPKYRTPPSRFLGPRSWNYALFRIDHCLTLTIYMRHHLSTLLPINSFFWLVRRSRSWYLFCIPGTSPALRSLKSIYQFSILYNDQFSLSIPVIVMSKNCETFTSLLLGF